MKFTELNTCKIAKNISKRVRKNISPRQIESFLESHPELDGKKYEEIYRAIYKYFMRFGAV